MSLENRGPKESKCLEGVYGMANVSALDGMRIGGIAFFMTIY